ncbi:hypothetical protein F4814DRAFT_192393 [Daldinia grandis]|nr:hypothetical protein F4814DRAFT_192393 [Daldinia grandis]
MQPVQVRDLPSSASFYAAIVQPLKLRYISANASSIVFGDSTSGAPVLEVKRLAPGQHLRPSRVILSAQSPSVVSAFRTAALRAEPDIQVDTFDEGRVEVTDFDGNKIEAVCPAGYRSSFARANSSAAMSSREPRTMMKRSATTSAVEPPPRETSGGYGAGTGMGTVLGAAAVGVAVGSALTYAFMSNGRQRATPRQEYEAALQRRASYPDPQPNVQPRYVEDKKYPPLSYGARYAQIEAPVRSRVVEDLDDRASRHTSHYTTASRSRRLSEAGSTRRPPMAADVEYISTTGTKYEQKLLMDREYRSQVGEDDRRSYAPSKYSGAPSRHTAAPSKYAAESEYRGRSSSKHRAPRPTEAETYVSSRSKRPISTARPPTRSHSRISARDLDLPESRTGWDDDDDVESIAPDDSISCVGDEGYTKRTHRHAAHAAPSMVGRFRRVVNEFDGKRRPLYGSEVK